MSEQVVLDFAVVLRDEVAARSEQPTDERGEHDLIRPVNRLAELAQTTSDDRATDQEADRERDAERLDRDAEDEDFRLHWTCAVGDIGTRGLYNQSR